jgi:hypothetical protein
MSSSTSSVSSVNITASTTAKSTFNLAAFLPVNKKNNSKLLQECLDGENNKSSLVGKSKQNSSCPWNIKNDSMTSSTIKTPAISVPPAEVHYMPNTGGSAFANQIPGPKKGRSLAEIQQQEEVARMQSNLSTLSGNSNNPWYVERRARAPSLDNVIQSEMREKEEAYELELALKAIAAAEKREKEDSDKNKNRKTSKNINKNSDKGKDALRQQKSTVMH